MLNMLPVTEERSSHLMRTCSDRVVGHVGVQATYVYRRITYEWPKHVLQLSAAAV